MAKNQPSARQSATVFLLVLFVPLTLAYAAVVSSSVGLVYRWFLLAHLAGLFGFMLSHGGAALAAFRIGREAELQRVEFFIGMARDPVVVLSMGASLALVLSTGISLGFFGNFWGRGWLWATLIAAIFITFSMSFLGRLQLDKALKAVERGTPPPRGHPEAAATVGLLGLILVLWLVVFKPF